MRNYISVNIVPQSLLLLSAIREHRCDTLEKVFQLKMVYGLNKQSALDFAEQCKWLIKQDSTIALSPRGGQILEAFNGSYVSQDLWRSILYDYISTCQPVWARRVPYGRKEAYLIMNEEEQRCFVEAGLIDSIDSAVVTWWDTLAEQERGKDTKSKSKTGRYGELLTICYEEKRTGVAPYWTAIESNLAGYDICSRRSATDGDQMLIEVKASTQDLAHAVCVITRHEWETALRDNNIGRYIFHLWCVHGEKKLLAIISTPEMSSQIPTDTNCGRWESVRIPFLPFEEQFVSVE